MSTSSGYVASDQQPKALFHFTSQFHLTAILQSGHLALSESNLNIREGNCGVVWLTSSPDPMNHGLKFNDAIPAELDKTRIRIAVRHKSSFEPWDEWSDRKGMDPSYKDSLISVAHAEETHKTWYVSERKIPLGDVLSIENLATGKAVCVQGVATSFPTAKPSNNRCQSVTDEYILSQRPEIRKRQTPQPPPPTLNQDIEMAEKSH